MTKIRKCLELLVSHSSVYCYLPINRVSCKNVMYTVVNSWVYEEEGVDTGMPSWEKAVIGADAAVGVILLGLCALIYRKYKKGSASGR